ncbi:NUDIX domain-containing protein [Candidatus Daviesbacteria bacterium]|nr:NUDIX domain-containing protein [Candidatus Daviesbacteria bacterium]
MEKHFTSTVYILCKIKGVVKMLLHKHKKLNIWIGVGGHVESWENPYEAALREAKEETGVKVKILISPTKIKPTYQVTEVPLPFMIKEEKIPQYKRVASHYHIDFTYFGTMEEPNQVSMNEEFGWFSQKDIAKLLLEDDVRVVVLAGFKNYARLLKRN